VKFPWPSLTTIEGKEDICDTFTVEVGAVRRGRAKQEQEQLRSCLLDTQPRLSILGCSRLAWERTPSPEL
jgi:hypothetical protein